MITTTTKRTTREQIWDLAAYLATGWYEAQTRNMDARFSIYWRKVRQGEGIKIAMPILDMASPGAEYTEGLKMSLAWDDETATRRIAEAAMTWPILGEVEAHTYTISSKAGPAIRNARLGQVRAAKAELEKNLSTVAGLAFSKWVIRDIRKDFEHKLDSRFVRLQFVNGSTVETALPVRILSAWLKAAPAEQVQIKIEKGAVTLQAGGSRLRLFTRNELERTRYGREQPLELLGEPVRLVAPANGGEFVLQGGAS